MPSPYLEFTMIRFVCIAVVLTANSMICAESEPATAPEAEVAKPTDAVVKGGKHGIDKYDTDKNGSLSKEELAAISEGKAKDRFLALDTNQDGAVDAEEIKAAKRSRKKAESEKAPVADLPVESAPASEPSMPAEPAAK